jgi:HK97 family phage major capsid protein
MMHARKRALLSGAIELKEGDGDPNIEIVTKALEDLQKSVGDRLRLLEERGIDPKLIERLDRIEAKANRKGGDGETEAKERAEAELKAWLNYIRKGPQASELEIKTLIVANDVQAGYLAPAEVSNEIIKDITEISPIRQYATVRQSTAASVKYPKRTGITNAKWEGEIEESEESNLTYGQTEIASKRLTTYVDISNSLLMGSDGTAEAEVRDAFSEDFAQKEGLAFVSGDGMKEPEGILTSAAVPYLANGHISNVSTDKLIDLMYSLKPFYRRRGVWLMNSTTIATIRKLKNGTTGEYLWQPALREGSPDTLLGRPIVDVTDWPDVAENEYPIAFGDLATAYRIVDRQQFATLTDPYTQAKRAITRIHGTRWVGGGVVQPAAIKKLKMAVS